MTDRERSDLRGAVRRCVLRRTWFFRKSGAHACDTQERGDMHTSEFREDGTVSSLVTRNPDGSEWTLVYEFDDDGRRIAARSSDGSLQRYEYDSQGRLLRVFHGERLAESITYETDGRKRKVTHVSPSALGRTMSFGICIEGSHSSYFAEGAETVTTVYDERQTPIELEFRDKAGLVLSRVTFHYDATGRLVEEAQKPSCVKAKPMPEMPQGLSTAQLLAVSQLLAAEEQPLRTLHRYDQQGRRIETQAAIGRMGGHTKRITYGDHGYPAEEAIEQEHREYSVDEQGITTQTASSSGASRSEARFCYDFDEQGNWITKTVEARSAPDAEFVVSSVERRTIHYFD